MPFNFSVALVVFLILFALCSSIICAGWLARKAEDYKEGLGIWVIALYICLAFSVILGIGVTK